jgi:hypothetical protein
MNQTTAHVIRWFIVAQSGSSNLTPFLDLLNEIIENKMMEREEDIPVHAPPQTSGLIVGGNG